MDSASNNLQWLMRHKTKPNQTKLLPQKLFKNKNNKQGPTIFRWANNSSVFSAPTCNIRSIFTAASNLILFSYTDCLNKAKEPRLLYKIFISIR